MRWSDPRRNAGGDDYADFLRENLYPQLFFRQLATQVTIPRGTGDKAKIPRWQTPVKHTNGVADVSAVLTAITQAVTEGTIISATGLSAQDITGVVVQFAGAKGYTDKLILTTKANYLEGALEALARELAFKVDRYTRYNISATSVKRSPVTTNKLASTDVLIGGNIARMSPYMDAAGTPAWEDECYICVTTPLARYDIYRDISATGFVSVKQYGDPTKIYRGEVGEMYGIRFLFSSAMPRIIGTAAASAVNGISPGATGANAYIFSPDAFYSLELEGGGVEVIHHPLGSSGSMRDPVNQLGSIGVKLFYGAVGAPQADSRLMRFVHGLGLRY